MKLNSVTKTEKNIVELSITIEKAEFDAATDKAYRQNAPKMSVPGFRKGKAPRKMIEKLYGEGVFFEDAVNICYPDAYTKAVEESGIEPIDQASIEIENMDENGFTFKAIVAVKPEVKVGTYKGLKAAKEDAAVTEEEVEKQLNVLAEQQARLVVSEKEAELGDTVMIDFEGFIDGVAFEGGKGDNFDLKLGSGMFIPGFEDQLVGKKAGEECDVNVTFPEQYGAAELAGKPAVFKCKVHEVKVTEMPVMDDEFAKDVSEFDTLDEYKADIKAKLEEDHKKHSDAHVDENIMKLLIEKLEADIPECMFENETENFVRDFDNKLRMQGLDLATYFKYTGLTLETLRTQMRPDAERQVKVRLALEKIASLEKLEATEE
ncbi:MAG: trigger factor, partial [Clostridia bacterium]|nr:trigger factor [Clostridia bacterium]